jgi:hypothetical protein
MISTYGSPFCFSSEIIVRIVFINCSYHSFCWKSESKIQLITVSWGCWGTSRFDAASLRNGPKPASAHPAPARLRHDPTRFSRSSEIEASDVPVHQPPDHEDDQEQPEYAADPKGPTLTVIAAAVVPKPASK